MNPAKNPYRLKQPGEALGEERQLIQLRDDSARPPVSVGVDFLRGFLFGAASQQPSQSEERRMSWRAYMVLAVMAIAGVLCVVWALAR